MFLDELNTIVEKMDTNFKIGYLAELYIRDFMKQIGKKPIQNWFVASYGYNDLLKVAINVRYKGEEESLVVRDIFLENNVPVLGMVYDFDADEFQIYEEKKGKYIPITEGTMQDKYYSNKRTDTHLTGDSRYEEIPILNNDSYVAFLKTLDNEEIKDFYIIRKEKLEELLFGHFQNIIDLDFCYIENNELRIVDVKNKNCRETFDLFVLNKGEAIYYEYLMSLDKVSMELFVLKHMVDSNERDNFLKAMIKKEQDVYPHFYRKKVDLPWLTTGRPCHLQDKDTFLYSWDEFECVDIFTVILNYKKRKVYKLIESYSKNYLKCRGYVFDDLFYSLLEEKEFVEVLKQIGSKDVVTLRNKNVAFVARNQNNEKPERWNLIFGEQYKHMMDNGTLDYIIFYEINEEAYNNGQYRDCFDVLGYATKEDANDFYCLKKEYALNQTNLNLVVKGITPVALRYPREEDVYFLNTKNQTGVLRYDFENML